MPSTLIDLPIATAGPRWIERRVRRRTLCNTAILLATVLSCSGGCIDRREAVDRAAGDDLYPPAPALARAAPLGNLLSGPPATPLGRELSLLLLGTEVEPTLELIKPTTITVRNDELLICDSVLRSIVTWNPKNTTLASLALRPRPERPVAAQVTPGGELLVVDAAAGQAMRYDIAGGRVCAYGVPAATFKPAFALEVDDEVWVSSVGGATVERFVAADGRHVGTLRGPDAPQGPFRMPYGLARTPSGEVLVVDMLAPTVHVFAPDGKWLRRFGTAGDRPGYFARPKYAAVAPDGTIFISDAGLQRIHVFDPQGRPLLALGGSRSPERRLTVPAGLAVGPVGFLKNETVPAGFQTNFALLASEQITNPGIRAFAWGEGRRLGGAGGAVEPVPTNTRSTANPHWSAAGCRTCHTAPGAPHAMDVAAAQSLCLSCHDGLKAAQEFHPIARIANTASIHTPSDWPVLDGRLTCLTCHDIVQHCNDAAPRPIDNPALLRRFDALTPFSICASCHSAESAPRINPHRLTGEAGRDVAKCSFCHTADLRENADGQRTGTPALRVASSNLCLSCHPRHWDYFNPGHVERPITDAVAANLARSAAGDGTIVRAGGKWRASDLLPTVNGRVVCYTCHNPHPPETYPRQSPLGLRSGAARDERLNFRLERSQLCFTCHAK